MFYFQGSILHGTNSAIQLWLWPYNNIMTLHADPVKYLPDAEEWGDKNTVIWCSSKWLWKQCIENIEENNGRNSLAQCPSCF